MRITMRRACINTRVLLGTSSRQTGTHLTPQRWAVLYHCRSVSLNPWKWKNDPKATPKQKELSRMLDRSTNADIYVSLRDPNIKLFPAPADVMPISEAIKFPKLTYFTPNFKAFPEDKPVLVCLSLRPNVALDMANSWLNPFHEKFPDLKAYNVTLLPNPGYKLLGPLLQLNLRNAIPPALWPYEGVHYTPIAYFSVNKAMTDLGLVGSNVFASYIYIVHKGLIRWKAVGMATDTELNTLKLVVHKLLGGTLKPPSSSPPSSSPPPPPSTPQNKPASHGKTV